MPFLDIGPIPPPPGVKPATPAVPSRATPPKLSARAGCLVVVALLACVLLTAAMMWAAIRWYTHTPGPAPSGGVQLGRDFRGPLCEALAEAFDADADALERKEAVTKADEALKETFAKARKQLFRDGPSPAFDAIVPAGKEPEDDAKRAEFVRLHRDFARGLRVKP